MPIAGEHKLLATVVRSDKVPTSEVGAARSCARYRHIRALPLSRNNEARLNRLPSCGAAAHIFYAIKSLFVKIAIFLPLRPLIRNWLDRFSCKNTSKLGKKEPRCCIYRPLGESHLSAILAASAVCARRMQ